jgi:cysteine-rich repeat protein
MTSARRGASALGMVGLVASLWGCNAIWGIFQAKPDPRMSCTTVDDCTITEATCVVDRRCEDRRCVFDYALFGTPLPSQKTGDCAEAVCDGQGGVTKLASPQEVEDDGNPCTEDTCSGIVVVHEPFHGPIVCYSGPMETRDRGICHAGFQLCEKGTPMGGCSGEVTPKPETCLQSGSDEDCDGLVDEGGEGCFCGDGLISINEESCDDGDADPTDGCSASCELVSCGNGFVDWNESCDDGQTSAQAGCPADCHLPIARMANRAHKTCTLLETGRVRCWGSNEGGLLGLGDTNDRGDEPGEMGAALPDVDIGTGAKAIAIAMGAYHTCVVLDSGAVRCWGANNLGQTGVGANIVLGDNPGEMGDALPDVDLGTGAKAIAVAAGDRHTCALLRDGRIKCWGDNSSGQLGLGESGTRGDDPGEMGDALPAVDLGEGRRASAITAGGNHTCALLQRDGTIRCWGNNTLGQLGLGDVFERGASSGQMGEALPAVDLGGGKALAVGAGARHTCALLADRTISCWGSNLQGTLGLGDMESRGDQAGEMGSALPRVDLGASGVLAAIVVGDYHVCARNFGGGVKCWGSGSTGATGSGLGIDVGGLPGEMGDALPFVDLGNGKMAVSLMAGSQGTCALLAGGEVKCWGSNGFGALGLGDVKTRGDDPGEMGDALPAVQVF